MSPQDPTSASALTSRLSHSSYLGHLRSESARFREVLAGADPAARVPGCPEWTATDLLWHLGPDVQGFWAHVVRTRPAAPEAWSAPARPASHAEVLAAFDAAHADLVEALEAADPADPAWTWAPEQTVGFTFRRQAHEALIHRVDAEQAAGVASAPVDVDLAADGVAETLGVMYGGSPEWGSFLPEPLHVLVDLTDAAPVWVQLGRFSGTDPDGGRTYDEPDIAVVDPPVAGLAAEPAAAPDATVSGTAVDVDLWLWQRGSDAAITVAGDRDVYDRFRACVGAPLN